VVEVIVTDEYLEWYDGLDDAGAEDVDVTVGILESLGVALGAPRRAISRVHRSLCGS
jgi:hypothetical protein